MIKTLTNLFKQDKEKFVVPKGVQDVIPIKTIYDDGIFQVGKDKFSKSFKFTDINYAVASREDKEAMFLEYSELLNSFDSGATTKITINNRRLNRLDFEKTILLPLRIPPMNMLRISSSVELTPPFTRVHTNLTKPDGGVWKPQRKTSTRQY